MHVAMATTSSTLNHFQSAASVSMPSSFPDSFKDFFQTLTEDGDDDSVDDDLATTMLEDKLIPRVGNNLMAPSCYDSIARGEKGDMPFLNRRGMSARYHSRKMVSSTPMVDGRGQSPINGSPLNGGRRRASSIAVTRQTPDLHRFLQTEQPRLFPGAPLQRAVLLNTSAPGSSAATFSRVHLSPGLCEPSPNRKRYNAEYGMNRIRTASMPAVPRHRPMLGDLRRSAIIPTTTTDVSDECEDVEYYRLRSFSITANGISNLGDSLRTRRSRSINSVTSTGTSESGGSRDRNSSCASQSSVMTIAVGDSGAGEKPPTYKVGMLGASGVGKTALTYQFTTSEYICAYDASLDEEYGQKTVSVMLNGQETELEIIDHPASEMSIESFCATYNVDVFVVVYSVVDRKSFKSAEEMLLYLWKGDYMDTKGVILVANKADLERKRQVPTGVGRRLANSCGCKFIETSSGLDHNVDELLVGILAQVKLNPKRERNFNKNQQRKRRHRSRIIGGSGRRILKHLLGLRRKTRSCENLFIL